MYRITHLSPGSDTACEVISQQMKQHIFDRTTGPIVILAVHLCGTLAIKAVDFLINMTMYNFFV
jgi:hypothetical protein